MPTRQRGSESYQVDVTYKGKRFRKSINGNKSNADMISAIVLDCMINNKPIEETLKKLNPESTTSLTLDELYRKTTNRYWYNTETKALGNATNVVDLIGKKTAKACDIL